MIVQQTKLTQELNKRERKTKGQTIINSSKTQATRRLLVQQTKLTQELNKRDRKTKGQTIINSSETQATSAYLYNKPN